MGDVQGGSNLKVSMLGEYKAQPQSTERSRGVEGIHPASERAASVVPNLLE